MLGGRYEYRPQQGWMAAEVAKVLQQGGVALIEAGTGTGKSLGYLLPLAVALQGAGPSRAVVATYTIHLQEQLLARDVPLAEQAAGHPLHAAVARGWTNHLCRARSYRLLSGRAAGLEGILTDEASAERLHDLSEWERTSTTGVFSDFPAHLAEVWPLVSADPDRCPRRRCPFYDECFYFLARRKVERARVIIANQHLLLSDVALRRQSPGVAEASVLPSFEYLVIDEAHHLEDVATDHLGFEVSRDAVLARLRRVTRGAMRGAAELAERATSALALLFEGVESWVSARGGDWAGAVRAVRLDEGDAERFLRGSTADDAVSAMTLLADRAEEMSDAVLRTDESDPDGRGMELAGLARWASRVAGALATVLAAEEPGYVFWVERSASRDIALRAAPLDVGPMLAGELFGAVRASILTSATLACGGDFGPLRRRLGLGDVAPPQAGAEEPVAGETGSDAITGEAEAEVDEWGVSRTLVGRSDALPVVRQHGGVTECVISSPFDFRRQALLAVPVDFPSPDHREFAERLGWLAATIAAAIGGRTFVLFTSHQALLTTRRTLSAHLERTGITVLAQGEGSRTLMLERFRQQDGEGAILLGTDSFWEGVDVPGPALSCVILARLPFPVPDHPFTRARAERLLQSGRSPFWEDALPRAITRFRQGFGRLIRTRQDRGAVVVADPRLLTRPYRIRFLDALARSVLVAGPAARIAGEVVAWVNGRPSSPSSWH